MNGFTLGKWRLIADENALESNGKKIVLRHKVMQVLLFLVQHHERVVSRDELINAIWDGNEGVGEKALTNAIWQLRSELQHEGDDDVIITIPKKGYQLKLPVNEIGNKGTSPALKSTATIGIAAVVVISVLVIGTLYLLSSQHTLPDWHLTTAQQQTQLPGNEVQATLSAQQDVIAFVNVHQGNSQLMMQVSDFSSPATVISSSEAGIHTPDWSPDGTRLVFIRQREDIACEVVIVDVVTLAETWHFVCHHPLASKVSFGPDGESIILFDIEPESSQSHYAQISLEDRKQSRLPITTSPRYLLEGDMKRSPDGKQLAITKSVGVNSEALAIYHFTTRQTELLTPNLSSIHGFSWMADQKHIVFAQSNDNKYDISVLNTDDLSITPLNISGTNPMIIGNHQALLYELAQTQSQLIELQQGIAQSGPWRTIDAKLPEGSDLNRYSQDVVFSNSTNDNQLTLYNLVTESEQHIPLPDAIRDITYPVISPDNNRIAFLAKSEQSDYLQIFVLTRNTNEVKQLSRAQGDHFAPAWSHNSDAVFTSSAITGDWEIWRYQLGQNTGQQVTQQGGGLIFQYQNQYFYSKADRPGLWTRAENDEEETLLVDLHQEDWGNWGVMNNSLFYVMRVNNSDTVVQRELQSGEEITLAKFPSGTINRYKNLWVNDATGTVVVQIRTLNESALVMRKG